MGRRTKTLLPIATTLLQPKHVEPQKVHDKLTSLRTQQKRYYDRGTKPLPVIRPGDAVRFQTPQGWRPAEVIRQHESPRSYVVKSGELAHEYRRNRNRLMITPETPHVIKPQFTQRRLTPPGTPVRRPQVLVPESPPTLCAGHTKQVSSVTCQHIEIEVIRDVMPYKLPDVEALVA